ncbi:MAG: gluconate 2-dehydrogenase subunit 3 family protein, partial [Gammaproteobacteria bacterium]|nr:gluconate 2-dehydrogenase subunit 3 family protein [Gammaproteobacteria bacterium]
LARGPEDFSSAAAEEQIARLTALDENALAAGNEDDFFREFKRLALFGYYSSEAGATIELQYERLTPEYKACVPIEDIGRAWFWANFRHGL